MKINKEKIQELVKILDELSLTELSYSDGKESIKVGKGAKAAVGFPPQAGQVSSKTKSSGAFKGVKSPMVGTAYLAPEPGAKPFVSVGSKVNKGDTVLIIEAMKTMNHIASTEDGVVEEICVGDGEAVEFDQELVKIK